MLQQIVPPDMQETAPAGDGLPPLALRLRIGRPEEFVQLRQFLEQASFTEAGICARGQCETVGDFPVPDEAPEPADALDVCLNLFLHGFSQPRAAVERFFGPAACELIERLGLVTTDHSDATRCYAPMALYPIYGLYLVSDQPRTLQKSLSEVQEDVVYPALPTTTSEFMASLPSTPCDRLLDLGSGTGVAALYAARHYASHAWAVDLTERSTRVCEFNARLNGIDNNTALQGDLYNPVADLTFDRIVAHPPYMPTENNQLIFRDGGEDGEFLTRKIIAGLPRHLAPGGRLHCRTLATDRKELPVQRRFRATLGEQHDEFDVAVVTNMSIPPARYYFRMITSGGLTPAGLSQQIASFESIGVESVLITFITIERHTENVPAITARRHLEQGRVPDPEAVDWLLRWERALVRDQQLNDQLRASMPTVSPRAKIQLDHQMIDGRLRARGCTVSAGRPFNFILESSPGLVLVIGACTGTRTVDQLHAEMKTVGAIPPETPIDEFLQFVRTLIGGGILEVPAFSLPLPPG